MPSSLLLNIAGYGSFLVAVKHALSGSQFQRLAQFQELPNIAFSCSTVGWYQGSAYMILTGLLNLHWSHNPRLLEEPLSRAMAALIVVIAWASSAWYLWRGLKGKGMMTAAAGVLQAWAALH